MASKKTSTKIKPKKAASEPLTGATAEGAFRTAKSEIEEVDADDVVTINVDVGTACTTGLGAADLIVPLVGDLVKLPHFNAKSVTHLHTYALATLYANATMTQNTGANAVALRMAEATPLRQDLLVAAEALAHKQLLSPQTVADIRSGQGQADTANDLIGLAALFQDAWDTVNSKTTVTLEEIARAEVLGSELHIALGLRRVGADLQSKPPESQLTRDRAFTLFVRAYDEVRRGVTFLRWYEGDVDSYAPSLYARGPRRVPTQPEGSPGASPTPTTEIPPTAALTEQPLSTEPAVQRT